MRAGLPSDVGENAAEDVEHRRLRARPHAVRALLGQGYVLPNRGQQGIPSSPSTPTRSSVEVYRIGDRNLAPDAAERRLPAPALELRRSTRIKERTGVKVYTGEMDVASKLNEDVTTAFPVTDAIRQAAARRLRLVAKPDQEAKDESYDAAATQWFIVSDLGLTAFTGDDGVHAFVRSLADATPIVERQRASLIARNNEVLGTAKTDSRGYAKLRCRPDARRRRPGAGRARRRKRRRRLRLPRSDAPAPSISPTAASRAAIPPGPIDAFVYTDRGVYRAGEEVHLTALVRDQTGKAVGRARHASSSRAPTASSTRRVTLTDQGLGGRATDAAARPAPP